MAQDDQCFHKFCANCGIVDVILLERYHAQLKICGRCKKQYYCSVECQRTHWVTHKQVCKSVVVSSEPNQ